MKLILGSSGRKLEQSTHFLRFPGIYFTILKHREDMNSKHSKTSKGFIYLGNFSEFHRMHNILN